MPYEIRMPALGQTSDELLILRWLKAEGDSVKLGEPLLEVETDKATLEVEAAAAGTLLQILYYADETIEAGTVIAYVGKPGELPVVEKFSSASVPQAALPVSTPPPLPQAGKVLAVPTARQLASENQIDIAQVTGSGKDGLIEKRDVQAVIDRARQLAVEVPHDNNKVAATPVARQMAREHSIDIAQVKGSGAGGRIEKRDVQAIIDQEAAASPVSGTDGMDIPVPRHRQVIAQRLTQSVTAIPQIRLTMTVNMVQARNLQTTQRNAGLTGLTYTHLILRAVAAAVRLHPALNRLWLPDGPRYRQLARADVGLAIANADNLLVATIAEPDHTTLTQLVRQAQDATERARRGTLSQADFNPASITISNLGMYGVDDFQAIVDPSQTAILAVGRVAEQVVVIDGGIRVVPQMNMSLTVDHRVADGVLAAQFLSTIREQLEHIEI